MLRETMVASEAVWCGVEADGGWEARCARIHRRLKRIVKARGALDAQEAAALREAQQHRLWRHYGYASLIEYMELEMGYSPRVALERLRVAKAIEELPVIAEALTQGDLSFSAAKELTRVATPETEQAWVEASAEKNVREVEALVSGHARGDEPTDPPDPKLVMRVLRYEVRQETAALERRAKLVLEKQRGERLDQDAFMRALFECALGSDREPQPRSSGMNGVDSAEQRADVAVSARPGAEGSPARLEPCGCARYQVANIVCTQCRRGWRDDGGVTVEMSPAALETALCDAQHVGDLDSGSVERAKNDIPPATRRKVKRRDHCRCRVPGCRSSANLDIHHIVPREKGGTHELENLITLCEAHHLARHEGSLIVEGRASNPTIVRRAHNKFTIAERAIETGKALKALGFDRHEARAAVEKTRAHVGTTALTIEQWIKIALGYCPKPSS